MFDKYTEQKGIAKKRINLSEDFDVFDLNAKFMYINIFWGKDITLHMIEIGDLRLISQGGGKINVKTSINLSDEELIKLYKSFVNCFFSLTGTNGYIWSHRINMIVLYFLTTTPVPVFKGRHKLSIYLGFIYLVFNLFNVDKLTYIFDIWKQD